jgi:hypothetical protein
VHFFINFDSINNHEIDSTSSEVNYSSSVFTFIFSRHPIFVSKAIIKTIRTFVTPKNLPAKFMAITPGLFDPYAIYNRFNPKCFNNSCSAAWVEAYLSWNVPFSSKPSMLYQILEKSAGSNVQDTIYVESLI